MQGEDLLQELLACLLFCLFSKTEVMRRHENIVEIIDRSWLFFVLSWLVCNKIGTKQLSLCGFMKLGNMLVFTIERYVTRYNCWISYSLACHVNQLEKEYTISATFVYILLVYSRLHVVSLMTFLHPACSACASFMLETK